jgi:hypothetical protein
LNGVGFPPIAGEAVPAQLYPRAGASFPMSRAAFPKSDSQFAAVEYLRSQVSGVLRMASPSIILHDRFDKDFYLVLEDFRNDAAFRETDEGIDYPTLIHDLLAGEYDQVLRIVAFNPNEGWSRDASEDVAHELERRIADGREIPGGLKDFIEGQLGRRIGVQLALPSGSRPMSSEGKPKGWQPGSERDHFIRCPCCGEMLDMRDLGQVLEHGESIEEEPTRH